MKHPHNSDVKNWLCSIYTKLKSCLYNPAYNCIFNPKYKQQFEQKKKTTIKPFGARGVMVIIAGYGHGDTSSNPGPD